MPSKKYPIIDYIYPGPQIGSCRGAASRRARGDHQALAELGFIVVAIDGMGTPGAPRHSMTPTIGDIEDNTLPTRSPA